MQAQLWTLSALAVELGRDRRSLARALEGLEPDEQETDGAERVTRRWRMARVFAHLAGSGDGLDAVAERARKDKEAADKLALENAVTREELGKLDEMEEWFGGHVERSRARLIQIPDALGQFCEPRNAAVVVAEARRLIYEALAELAADGSETGAEGGEALGAAADPDGERMGGQEPPAVERKQRRAGAVAN